MTHEDTAVRELTAVATALYDADEATLEEVVLATGLPSPRVAELVALLIRRGEAEALPDGRFGWLG